MKILHTEEKLNLQMLRKQRKMLQSENGEINSVKFLEEVFNLSDEKGRQIKTQQSCLRGIQ